jgi:iron complex outermembrane receptor protein
MRRMIRLVLATAAAGSTLTGWAQTVTPEHDSNVGGDSLQTTLPLLADLSAERAAGAIRLAQATGAPSASERFTDRRQRMEGNLEEVIVTAQKRSERLQDVPVPVTAVDADALVQSNQLQIQQYYAKIPGFNLTTLGDLGAPVASIRGVTTGGFTNPTVAVVVDDVPFSSSTITAAGYVTPDFDPSELARVEVLRGPQGTLYGASSLSGLLKYVTVDPSTERLNGRVQVGSTSVKNGDEIGYSVRGSVNVPLGDTVAIRASGSTRMDPGYIDDPRLGVEGVNETEADSGRLAMLWRPSDAFALKLSALYQQSERAGANTVYKLAGLTDLQHTDLPNTGGYDIKLQAYSATMTAVLGAAEVTSVTGFSVNEIVSAIDASHSALLSARTQTRFGVPGITNPAESKTEKLSQELRVALPIGERIDWLIGGFYAHEKYFTISNIYAINPATGDAVGQWFHAERPAEFEEFAAFTNMTFSITDRFDVQVGARGSDITFATGAEHAVGPWNLVTLGRTSENVVLPEFEASDNSFTYLLTPRFRISPDLMTYVRLASGYRPGGPNTSAIARAAGLPLEYEADTTQNYEIGIKGDVLDRALSFDASIYYIDWKDIQVQLRDASSLQFFFVNVGRAKSQGVELSLEVRPFTGTTISAWGALNEAELKESFPAAAITTFGRAGDRLPYSSRLSGNLSADQEFVFANGATLTFGASASFVGDRKGAFFAQTAQRETFPSYTQVDLRAGLALGTWTLNAFVNNVGDKRGVLRSGRDSSLSLPFSYTYIQPRTTGLFVTKTF